MDDLTLDPTHARANGVEPPEGRFFSFLETLGALSRDALDSDQLLESARLVLLDELQHQALTLGRVRLSSGVWADYYVDVKRSVLSKTAAVAAGLLIAKEAQRLGVRAIGGLTIGADPLACAALILGPEAQAFLVRKNVKEHGLERRIEGPPLRQREPCLIVDDVVTKGGSVIDAINYVREVCATVAGVVSVVDRKAGGSDAIREALRGAPYTALTTIDEVHPARTDR